MKISDTCRTATLEDVPDIIDLTKEFFHQTPYAEFEFDFSEAKVRRLAEACIINPKEAVVLMSVDKDTGANVGLIAGRLDTSPFSDEKVAIEVCWYVRPEYRKGKRAFELLDAFEAWAKAAGAGYTYYGLMRETDAPPAGPVEKIYRHRGCKPSEAGYVKNLRKKR